MLLATENQPKVLKALKAVFPLYSFWNLDFFRSLLPDICLNVNTLEALALDYTVAIYPIVLIAISYVLIEMYDHNIRCAVYLWKPFNWIFSFFRKSWNIRTSLIDSSATFFLLLYVKILSVSGDLLMFTSVHGLNGSVYHALYYDSSVRYFGKEDLPYGILAIFSLVFVLPLFWLFILFSPFKSFCLVFPYNGIFFMPLWIPFKALTRTELSLELTTVAGLHSLVFSSDLHYSLFMLPH